MKYLNFKRNLQVYQNVYNFNYLIVEWIHESWLKDHVLPSGLNNAEGDVIKKSDEEFQGNEQSVIVGKINSLLNIKPICSQEMVQSSFLIKEFGLTNYYTNVDDLWLRVISLPTIQLKKLFDLVILTILFYNRSLCLDGKKLRVIKQYYEKWQIDLVLQMTPSTIPFLNIDDGDFVLWQDTCRYNLLQKLFSNKDQAIKERIKFLFDKNIASEDIASASVASQEYLNDYFGILPIDKLEKIVGDIVSRIRLHLYNFKTI